MKNVNSMFGVFFVVSTLLMSVSIHAEDEIAMTSLQVNEEKNSTTSLSSGMYEPYGLGNKFRVTSTLLANPSRLDSVNFAGAYQIEALTEQTDLTAASSIAKAFATGEATIAIQDEGGNYFVDAGISKDAADAVIMAADCVSTNETCDGNWAEVLLPFLNSAGVDATKAKVITASPSIIPAEPQASLINWNRQPVADASPKG